MEAKLQGLCRRESIAREWVMGGAFSKMGPDQERHLERGKGKERKGDRRQKKKCECPCIVQASRSLA